MEEKGINAQDEDFSPMIKNYDYTPGDMKIIGSNVKTNEKSPNATAAFPI
jgi:hypothetical protein